MSLMRTGSSRAVKTCLIACCCLVLLAACGGDDNAAQPPAAAPTASEPGPVAAQTTVGAPADAISTPAAASQVEACTLLTQAEVEAAVGRPVLQPKAEQAANLACCSYGDPETPIVSAATLCVFVGSDADYFAGAAAQTRETFEQFKSNAASAEPVSELGEDAYWDDVFGTLHVLDGHYEVNLELMLDNEEEGAALAAAKALAAQALQRLPD